MSDIDPKVLDAAFERVSERLYKWLFTQAEWPLVLAAPRNVRKQYARRLADHVTRIPVFITQSPLQAKASSLLEKSDALKAAREAHDVALD